MCFLMKGETRTGWQTFPFRPLKPIDQQRNANHVAVKVTGTKRFRKFRPHAFHIVRHTVADSSDFLPSVNITRDPNGQFVTFSATYSMSQLYSRSFISASKMQTVSLYGFVPRSYFPLASRDGICTVTFNIFYILRILGRHVSISRRGRNANYYNLITFKSHSTDVVVCRPCHDTWSVWFAEKRPFY